MRQPQRNRTLFPSLRPTPRRPVWGVTSNPVPRVWQHENHLRVGRMVRKHLEGILTVVVQRVTNARAEGIHSSIQWLKYRPRGYRNRQRFRDAIYFHFGGLDVYPDGVAQRPLTHTNS